MSFPRNSVPCPTCGWQRGRESEKKPGVKTAQVKARMETVDHDRQGQAAPRRYRQITHSSLVHFR